MEYNFNHNNPYPTDFLNDFPTLNFAKEHKQLLKFGTIQDMMTNDVSPSDSSPNY
jgi:hypothetical protein